MCVVTCNVMCVVMCLVMGCVLCLVTCHMYRQVMFIDMSCVVTCHVSDMSCVVPCRVCLQEKLQQLYESDRELQEKSFLVQSLQEDKVCSGPFIKTSSFIKTRSLH